MRRGPPSPAPRIAAPAPVTVHWAVGGRWQPYSRGVRYWRSAVQKWEDTATPARSPKPPSRAIAARISPSPKVEQAPYRPKKGTSCPRAAKEELTHWLSRSPANSQSSFCTGQPHFSAALDSALCCMARSARSQVGSPKVSSPSM